MKLRLAVGGLAIAAAASALSLFIADPFGGSSQEPDEPQAVGTPTLSETVLRLQAPASVACSGTPFEVEVFLDDLEARETATDGVRLGVTAFQLQVRYDPIVLNVEGVVLGPALGTIDADQDGVVRPFVLAGPRPLDNDEGVVGFGGLALIADRSELEQPGIDPVAAGGPVLLASLRMRTVGEGASPLTIHAPRLLDGTNADYTVTETETRTVVEPGACAARLPGPTPYVPPPTPQPTSIPIPPEREALPAGLSDPGPGCVWRVSNPEPPVQVIIKYCGDSQTTWLYNVESGQLTQAEVVGDAVVDCDRGTEISPDQRRAICEGERAVPPPPAPGAGCNWYIAHLASGWIDGDPGPPPAPWDVLVEVCAQRMSGRVYDPETGDVFQTTPRDAPVVSS